MIKLMKIERVSAKFFHLRLTLISDYTLDELPLEVRELPDGASNKKHSCITIRVPYNNFLTNGRYARARRASHTFTFMLANRDAI